MKKFILLTTLLLTVFGSSLSAAEQEAAEKYLNLARQSKKNGELVEAAVLYSRGLQEMKALTDSLAADSTMVQPEAETGAAAPAVAETADSLALASDSIPLSAEELLINQLREEYLSVFDSIEVKGLNESCPTEMDAPVPVALTFQVSMAGKPLHNLPMKVTLKRGKASIAAPTDREGYCKVKIEKAPAWEKSRLQVTVDDAIFDMLPDCDEKEELIKKMQGKFDIGETLLIATDMTATYCLDMETDSTTTEMFVDLIENYGWTATEDKAQADLILKLDYSGTTGDPVTHDKYNLATTHCKMKLRLFIRETDEDLASVAVDSFEMTLPAGRSPEKIQQRGIALMFKPLKADFVAQIVKANYSKSAFMYRDIK